MTRIGLFIVVICLTVAAWLCVAEAYAAALLNAGAAGLCVACERIKREVKDDARLIERRKKVR